MKLELPNFPQLRRQGRAATPGGLRIALAGDCATQHLAEALRGYAAWQEVPAMLFDADYDQILAQVMDPASELYTFRPDYLVLYLCVEKLWERWCDTEERTRFAERTLQQLRAIHESFAAHCPGARIVQLNFAELDEGVFGSFGQTVEASFLYQVRLLNLRLGALCAESRTCYPVDLAALQAQIGRDRFHDARMYCIAKLPIRTEYLPHTAKAIWDVIFALQGHIAKCVICDLDNTLWGGVIGDDGLEGIELGELGRGRAFTQLQRWLKELKKRGILLAVCSKNNEETAKAPFLHHPDTVLHLEDFAVFVANWEDKATNIRRIQQILNLGLDSFVFLDDNPFERELVRSLLPQVTVPELPEDPAGYVGYLQSLNLFETASYSEADGRRTEQYRQEADRTQLAAQLGSFEEYLQSLQMVAQTKPFDSFHIPRIAQLTQRSNQFNLRTVRYTEEQAAMAAKNPQRLTRYFTLRDRFGDYGLISVVILQRLSADSALIETWLMSCRVLKRSMEEFIINETVRAAADWGVKCLIGEYLPTAKNAMVRDIYTRLGFRAVDDGRFVCDTAAFSPLSTYIMKGEDNG